MSLIYSLVSQGTDKLLVDYTEYQGNFENVSQSLLKKVQENHRATFSYERAYVFA